MNTITERHDRLDCALNCAGEATEHPSIAPLAELTDEDFEKALSVNVWGVIWGMQAEIKMMMKNKKGTIVNVSSTFTQRPIPYLGPHIMTKMAVEGLSKSAALEYANCGIRINTLDVGPTVDSDSLRNFVAAISQRSGQSCSDVAREFESHLPTGKYLCDDDVANSALWLLSGWSKGVLGHSLVIDNGFSSH
ncbi:SDR family oxidoreductase [Pelomyxa schiedti]|nr:SDR family oxidoreductase [Pelomyxa schiedti]